MINAFKSFTVAPDSGGGESGGTEAATPDAAARAEAEEVLVEVPGKDEAEGETHLVLLTAPALAKVLAILEATKLHQVDESDFFGLTHPEVEEMKSRRDRCVRMSRTCVT